MQVITDAVLDFWFGGKDTGVVAEPRAVWFQKDVDFDQEIRTRFSDAVEHALNGDFNDKVQTPEDYLAVIILLDQFPRNLFRGSQRAFAGDALARRMARQAIVKGLDKTFSTHYRMFFYLPFEHSEALADQDWCMVLFEELGDDNYLGYAKSHYDIIAQYGRFPHRNVALGRENTPAEDEYLKDPNAGF